MIKDLSCIVQPLCGWYRSNKKPLPWRLDPTPYHVWISEIMLQQTRIEAVIPYYARFLEAFPSVSALAEADDDRLMKLWEGLGYYSRARNLKRAAIEICDRFGGQLPADAALLRSLPGIGDYTAGAIASIAFGLPEPAVDGNVLRVLSRLAAWDANIAKPAAKRAAADWLRAVYPSGDEAGLFTEGLMELGENVCIPNGLPKCEACPLASFCEANRSGRTGDYPVRSQKAARRMEVRTVLLIEWDNRIAVQKRPERGLLAGLWEFPSLDGEADESAVRDYLRQNGLEARHITPVGSAVHIFSHVEWHMKGLKIEAEPLADAVCPLVFASREERGDIYAIPSAFRYFSSLL